MSIYLVDAHRSAQDSADRCSLPQTVFYHPEWGYAHAHIYSHILDDRQTQKFVTWLPTRFFQ